MKSFPRPQVKPMNDVMANGLQRYLDRLPASAHHQYQTIAALMTQRFGAEPLYKDGSPVFVKGSLILRVGVFADHANLFVRGSSLVRTFFEPSQLTPKGMVQWFYRDPFPIALLTRWIEAELAAPTPCDPS
jgi:hypothetical protein